MVRDSEPAQWKLRHLRFTFATPLLTPTRVDRLRADLITLRASGVLATHLIRAELSSAGCRSTGH